MGMKAEKDRHQDRRKDFFMMVKVELLMHHPSSWA